MFARRLTKLSAAAQSVGAVRRMAGHHHPPPQGGIDGFVRKYLPGDHQMALGVMGIYVSIYFLVKLTGSKKEAAPAVAAAPVAAAPSNGEIPSVESPEFDQWISTAGNVEKLFA